jgi:hypothetical protein
VSRGSAAIGRGNPLEAEAQGRYRHETRPEGQRWNQSVKRSRKPEGAAQSGEANPAQVAVSVRKRRRAAKTPRKGHLWALQARLLVPPRMRMSWLRMRVQASGSGDTLDVRPRASGQRGCRTMRPAARALQTTERRGDGYPSGWPANRSARWEHPTNRVPGTRAESWSPVQCDERKHARRRRRASRSEP